MQVPDGITAASTVIVDNTAQQPLVSTIKSLLDGAYLARLSVGYLFVEGLAPLVDALDNVDRIELLIGNVVNRLTDEQLRESGLLPVAIRAVDEEFAADFREARNRAATETALNLRVTIDKLARNDHNGDLLISLAHWIAAGKLRVRLSTRHRLHAKVTIAGYPDDHPLAPGRAIVGTSNFTMPLATTRDSAGSNIDVLLQGKQNYDQLMAWYDHHWMEAQDFHRELFEVLGRAWPLVRS